MSALSVPARGRRHPMTVVTQARKYAADGWKTADIVRFFAEDGITVGKDAVARWTNPQVEESARQRILKRNRRYASERSGRLGRPDLTTPEFKFARMRALRDEAGMTCGGIAKVMRFDFGDPLTDRQVRHALNVSGHYPEVVA